MAILKAVNSRASLGNAIRYITKKEKTEAKLISGYNCREGNPLAQMMMTKKLWGKTGGRQYKHFIISFAKDENITYDEVHKIALEFIEKWHKLKGFEVCLATHKDREHIHSHFIINSVNSENGKMFHQSKRELTEAKLLMNEILKEHCKSILEVGSKSENITTDKGSKYRAIEKAAAGNYKSYMLDMAVAVNQALEKAVSRENFIEIMKEQGIAVNWSDIRKYVTFTDSAGHKVRNSNLGKTFKMKLSKEEMLNEFTRNKESAELTDGFKDSPEYLIAGYYAGKAADYTDEPDGADSTAGGYENNDFSYEPENITVEERAFRRNQIELEIERRNQEYSPTAEKLRRDNGGLPQNEAGSNRTSEQDRNINKTDKSKKRRHYGPEL